MKLLLVLLLVTGLCISMAYSSSTQESSRLAFGESQAKADDNLETASSATPNYDMDQLDEEDDEELVEYDDGMI